MVFFLINCQTFGELSKQKQCPNVVYLLWICVNCVKKNPTYKQRMGIKCPGFISGELCHIRGSSSFCLLKTETLPFADQTFCSSTYQHHNKTHLHNGCLMANLAHFNKINKQLPALHHFKVVRANQGLREEGKNKTPSGGATTHLFYFYNNPLLWFPKNKLVNKMSKYWLFQQL